MGYIPIFMQVAGGVRCLVVGGGAIAERKTGSLLEGGADVTVVSPTLTRFLNRQAASGRIRHISRAYEAGDLRGYALVFAASDDAALHRALFEEARALGIPINVADEPEMCSFIMPAVVRRGALTIAVSTTGSSPAMAKRIADRIGRIFGPEYALALEILRAARMRLKQRETSAVKRSRALSGLAASRLPALLRDGDVSGIERLMRRHVGAGLEELGLARVQSGETRAAR